jgi:hypothetical protein
VVRASVDRHQHVHAAGLDHALRGNGDLVVKWLFVLAACGAHAVHPKPTPPAGDELVLYRDAAAVRQHVTVPSIVQVPQGVTAQQVLVLGNATVRSSEPGTVAIAGTPGTTVIAYLTEKLSWDAAYTMTTTPARDRAVLDGALAVRNTTGVALRGALRVVDADLGTARSRAAAHVASSLLAGQADLTQTAATRDVGTVVLPPGETRIALVEGTPHRMHAVLVFDPIGTKLDNPSSVPLRDVSLGVDTPSTKVSESFEIARDERETADLPAGPVRLFERRPDGTLGLLGEARLFEPQTLRSALDTIAVGTAAGVTAHRVRRELTDDEARHRLVEEFVITVENARDQPVDVLVREHLYRGMTWAVAYHSVDDVMQEGSQAFVMRTRVPAAGHVKILYVVVYTWDT